MSLDINQLVTYIICPVLKQVGIYSPEGEQLVLGTGAKESGFKYIHQIGGGPALGFYQMEPATYWNLWNQYLLNKPELRKLILSVCKYSTIPSEDFLMHDLRLATIMCRVRYMWINSPIPAFNDIDGQAKYWAKYYNANPVTGVPNEYVEAYNRCIAPFYQK